ncbi:hypothetical protein [Aeromonas caviae]|uniref:hypothetical protein n=1 Tax=Aeromonas caviae TaxID=648 RepID=UPI0022531B78|nr:hypothetical protein [Aeromonas caviae]MCX4071948.1 hypothetical protein [Aeromonas caviae]
MKVFNIKALAHFGILVLFAKIAHGSEVLFHISDSWSALIFALQVPFHISLFCTKLANLNKTNVPVYYGTTKDGKHYYDCEERGWSFCSNTATQLSRTDIESPYILMNHQDLFDAIANEQARK